MIKLPFFRTRIEPYIRLTEQQRRMRDIVLDKITGGEYQLENISCICGAGQHDIIAETERYGLPLKTVICRSCGLLRTEPQPTEDALSSFYMKEYRDLYMGPEYGDMESYFADMVRRGEGILRVVREACPGLNLQGKRVLEIGCSAGGILVPFLAGECTVRGYDYDERYLAFGMQNNNKLDLRKGDVGSLELENEYDIIIMNHVLEHLKSPKETIREVRSHLAENGILYLGVPGLKNSSYYFSPTRSFLGTLHIAHLYHFTRNSLKSICEGFQLLYGDDLIQAVFQKQFSRDGQQDAFAASEYDLTLSYLEHHERSWQGRIQRLILVIRAFPSLLTLIFPELVSSAIKSFYGRLRSLKRWRL